MRRMSGTLVLYLLFFSAIFFSTILGGRQMPKLSEKKLCADEECSPQKCEAARKYKAYSLEESDSVTKLKPLTKDKLALPLIHKQDPISMAVALDDYFPSDCRFIPIQKGQIIYVFSKLKGRGRLFWAGSVQGNYYSEQEARIGFFPSSIVEETQLLLPGTVEVPTDKWDFYCQ